MIELENNTLFKWLEANAKVRPNQVALLTTTASITYIELENQVLRLATAFAQLGIGKGDVVACQLPNCPEFIVTFLACATRGVIFQTLHMPYRKAELAELIAHGEAKAVISLGAFKDYSPAQDILELADDLPNLKSVIALGTPVQGALSFADLLESPAERSSIVETDIDDPYLLLYTSGTTASPKGVPHHYRGFLDNAWRTAKELQLSSDDRVCSLAPFSHLYGLMVVHLALASGGANALVPAFNPETFIADVSTLKPTALFSAPAHFAPFIAANKFKKSHFEKTKLVCLSGAAVPPQLARAVDDLLDKGEVIQLWGMSELQAGAYGRPGDPKAERMETTGRAAPGSELRIVDENAMQVKTGEEGALEIRGSSVFDGYRNNQAETGKSFTKDGWFKTGDLGVLDYNGFLRLTGRAKEVINRGGVKFNPIDIEVHLMSLPAITQCAIVPIPDEVLGEKACLCVEVNEGEKLTLEEVTTHLNQIGIAKYKWPERLEIFDEMPLTPTRKIMRGKLTAMLI
ncbi:MAG: class I adenylate-forming enzyme family protein [Rhizobiaceae bacterium]